MAQWVLSVVGSTLMLMIIPVATHAFVTRNFPKLAAAAGMALVAGLVTFTNALPDLLTWIEHGGSGRSSGTASVPQVPSPPRQDSAAALSPTTIWILIGAVAAVAAVATTAKVVSRARRRAARWKQIQVEHEKIRGQWTDFVTDPLAVLDRPTLASVATEQTAAFLHALDAADDAHRGKDLADYRAKVSQLKTSWQAADELARRVGVSQLPEAERAAVVQARKLLTMALDAGASETERQVAYARARTLLDGIITLPKEAVAALESTHRLVLEPAASLPADALPPQARGELRPHDRRR